MAEPTLKDVMVSLSDINTNVKSINERLSNLDSSMENVNSRLNKLETLNFKIAQVEDSQEMISKEYESQKVIINEIQRKNKYLEGGDDQLHQRMIILEKLIYSEQEKRIHLEQYGRCKMVEIRGIPLKENENCIKLCEKHCELLGMANCTGVIEIAHRNKNGDIIAKFRDRPTRDTLYKKKESLKITPQKILDLQKNITYL